jgi:hypothetical protein
MPGSIAEQGGRARHSDLPTADGHCAEESGGGAVFLSLICAFGTGRPARCKVLQMLQTWSAGRVAGQCLKRENRSEMQ